MPNEPSLVAINKHLDEAGAENNQVNLVYKIEGTPDEIPIFELAHTLQALGAVAYSGEADHYSGMMAIAIPGSSRS